MKTKTINKILIISLLSVSVTACGGFFDKDNTPPPSPLVNFKAEAFPRSLWYTSTGSGITGDYLKLVPALDNNTIYTADKSGRVTATDKNSGKSLWSVNAGAEITAGPGAGNNVVVVGSRDGHVIALSQVNGSTLWRTQTSTEILAAPAISNGIALIKTIDGKVTAYSAQDGHVIWTYQQVEPNLILRGASAPKMTEDAAIVGFANGNLLKLTLHGGNLIWQKTVAIPEGGFTIQRMVDIDADPLVSGKRVYVATYQGRISALDLSSGQDIWTHDISSYTGITADSEHAFVTDARSHVWAFDANNGAVNWRQPELEARNITGPVTMGNYIVVGDAEGYLHWMSKQDGHFIGRIKVNGSGIIATPVVNNGILYVVTKDGHLAAYTLG